MTAPQAGASTRARAILALLALVLASGVAGAAMDRAVVRAQRLDTLHDTAFHPLSSILRSSTPADRLHYREQLKSALDLTTAQDSAIERVMSDRAGRFNALRDEIRPRVDSLVTDVRAGIEGVLNEQQRVAFRKLQQRGQEQLVTNGHTP